MGDKVPMERYIKGGDVRASSLVLDMALRNTLQPLLLLLLAGLSLPAPSASTPYGEEVVCYFSSWARWRPGDGMFDVEDIDPFLCTHLVFAFTGLSNDTWEMEVLDPWNELCPEEDGGYLCAFDRFVALKEENPDLKTILAVGGWNEGSEDYSVMAADPEKRRTFIESSVARINKHGFDGLDLDWEYPTLRGGNPEDKENFVTLVQELREAFDKFNPPLTITGAFAAGKPTIDEAYDVSALVPLIDKWHVMAYDYHGAWENFTHHNSPLCGYYLDWDEFIYFNVKFTTEYYLELGVPKENMVIGIPTYGRSWTLHDIDDNGILAPAYGPGPAGPYIRINGTLGANEICEKLQDAEDGDCTIVHDPALLEPYFYCRSDNIWCGYDDVDSVYLKARFAKNMGLAGVMVWQIDTDDFHPFCADERFPLINSMKRALHEPAGGDILECPEITPTMGETTTPEITTTTAAPTTTTPTTKPPTTTTTPEPPITTTSSPPSTNDPSQRPDCTGLPEGTTFPHSDCDKYWQCINGFGILMLCGPGSLWDDDIKVCNHEDEVDTSNCFQWFCSVDNTFFPHPDCDKYYQCDHGAPVIKQCEHGLYWSQSVLTCLDPSLVDTSGCNIP